MSVMPPLEIVQQVFVELLHFISSDLRRHVHISMELFFTEKHSREFIIFSK